MYQIKTNLPDYVLPNLTVNKNDYFVPRAIGDVKETEWGWHSNVLARLLCPMKLVDQFDIVTINTLYSADAPIPRMFSSLLVL